MLVLDGAANANSRIWEQTIAVSANTDYVLSFWLANLNSQFYGGPQPNISARIGGLEVLSTGLLPYAPGMVPSAQGVWAGFSTVINSGASTSLVLSFVDTANTHEYNDFAFDDVSLVAQEQNGVPEPGTWALMLAGFGLTGAALRRRRSVLALALH
ncbi:MAG: PEPxxWA-CTERM sorting domain-containing protein [Alphaproteobacteria bacterium]|nr:PEPxxWA-CTERM sorting domain-containing protein [Alphaproteobacteria bacterium]MBU1516060.1 PEPxxWA-CTERM sorting domain-containing protein [Alphaproteobacteria bacterium]MBU2092725.1 PEPxxWA-CTERM sorting domain-containing protein [Alphaproteobacteria bacterium]MBU2153750.1 PEPxxWA-CTERM sorting domain-containing protein [Alphaproteobacteria bacterium]MBU2308378.1 PEPxxWA-CTERM sorting domain-containing protein [Alphaproteobacteria bacterium]